MVVQFIALTPPFALDERQGAPYNPGMETFLALFILATCFMKAFMGPQKLFARTCLALLLPAAFHVRGEPLLGAFLASGLAFMGIAAFAVMESIHSWHLLKRLLNRGQG